MSNEDPQKSPRPHWMPLINLVAMPLLAGFALYISNKAMTTANELKREEREHSEQLRHEESEHSKQLKSLETAHQLYSQFYQTEKDKPRKSDDQQMDFYYEEVYRLQSLEFTFYKKGQLDREPYVHWLRYRSKVYKSDKTEQKQWERIRAHEMHNPEFLAFMDSVLNVQDGKTIEELVAKLDVNPAGIK